MMGSAKANSIRKQVRSALQMTDSELLEWFDRKQVDLVHKPKANRTEMDTLRLFRDALVKEAKQAKPKRATIRARS